MEDRGGGRNTGEVAPAGVAGEGESLAALQRGASGRRGSGLDATAGGRRRVGGGLETAVAEVRRPNPDNSN